MWKTIFITVAAAIFGILGFLAYDAVAHGYHRRGAGQAEFDALYVRDAELGFTLRPGASLVMRGERGEVTAQIGRLGTRVAGRGDQAVADVVVVGCSQTFGQGVAYDEIFASVAAKDLGWTVANLAVSGFGGVGAHLMLRRHLGLKPKLIVYGFWFDHLNRNVLGCLESGSPVCIERPYLAFERGPDPILRLPSGEGGGLAFAASWMNKGGLYAFAAGMVVSALKIKYAMDHAWLGSREIGESQRLDAARTVLKEMNDTAKIAGAKLIVVFIPNYFAEEVPAVPAVLSTWAVSAGITLINMAPVFARMKAAGIPLAIPNDGHMTVAAHRAIADEIVKSVR